MAAPADDEVTALAATRKLKLKPPTYDGNYATYEEWKYKFTAYMGLQGCLGWQKQQRGEPAGTFKGST